MPTSYEIGPFRLDTGAEILYRGTEPVAVGQRAVALLGVLVTHAGTPVAKEALIEAAWPGLAVEESNLTVQIAALRRVFAEEPGGERWIETLPRRGYRFVGPVEATDAEGALPAEKPTEAPPALSSPTSRRLPSCRSRTCRAIPSRSILPTELSKKSLRRYRAFGISSSSPGTRASPTRAERWT